MAQIGLKLFKVSNMLQYSPSGKNGKKNSHKKSKIVPNSSKGSITVLYGPILSKTVLNGFKCFKIVLNGPIWSKKVEYGPKSSKLVLNYPTIKISSRPRFGTLNEWSRVSLSSRSLS